MEYFNKIKNLINIDLKLMFIRFFSRVFGKCLKTNAFKTFIGFMTSVGSVFAKAMVFIYSLLWIVALFLHSKLSKLFAPTVKTYIYKIRPKIWNFTSQLEHRKFSRVSVVLAGTIIGLAFTAASIYSVGISVSVNGEFIGYIENEEELEKVISDIENSAEAVLNEPYTLEADVKLSISVAVPDDYLNYDEMRVVLSQNVSEITSLAVVSVDGQVIGALSDIESANEVIEEIKLERVDGDTAASVEFVQNLKVELLDTSVSMVITPEQLYERLNATKEGEHIYEVKSGDTISEIAQGYDMKTSEVLALNPDVSSEDIQIGQEIVVSAAIPTLSAKVTREVEYTETIPYDTITEENSDMIKNTKNTIQSGSDGSAYVNAEVITVDGVEVERIITNRVVLEEPTDEVLEVGTKVVAHIGTGDMIRPYGGYMSSNYGYRSSGFHTGVDFAGSSGSTVVASDNGRVVFSGWNGGYGNCVIIDHGNGIETLYAHNSSNAVSVGQVVAKGQKIGSLGSTGNSTGPHVHFEVRINGTHVNPWGYID